MKHLECQILPSKEIKTPANRIVGIDLARAVAIIGMMIIHFNENTGTIPYSGPDWLVWMAYQMEGRAAVIFVILAGIGMSLMAARTRISNDPAERQKVQNTLFKRSMILFVFGLLFHVIWNGDILHVYGVFIAIGAMLLFAPATWLLIGTALLNVGFFVMLLALNGRGGWSYDSGWNWDALFYTDFYTLKGFVRGIVFNGWFPIFPWLGFLLAGICLGRMDLRSRSLRLRCMFWGGVAALAAYPASWLLVHHIGPKWMHLPFEFSYALFGLECLPPNPLFALQAGGASIFMIALCLETAECFRNARWLQHWALFGQFALSIYIGHVIFGIAPLEYLGWTHKTLLISVPTGLVCICITLALCLLWRRRFPRGPLEMVVHRLIKTNPQAKALAESAP